MTTTQYTMLKQWQLGNIHCWINDNSTTNNAETMTTQQQTMMTHRHYNAKIMTTQQQNNAETMTTQQQTMTTQQQNNAKIMTTQQQNNAETMTTQQQTMFVWLFALRPMSTAMVIAGRSVHLTTLFSWAGLSKRLTSNLCTYFRL